MPAPAPAAKRLPDDHPAWKDLRPFGYECARWLAAMTMLQARWRKGRLGAPMAAFLQDWMPRDTVPAVLPEDFEIVFEGGVLDGDASLGPVMQPVWQALLHLPALRDFWTAELRASHYAHLLRMIPRAWCMDPAPVPPGAVIAGLGIASWEDVPRLEQSGLQFTRHPAGENRVVLVAAPAIVEAWRARYIRRDGQIVLQDACTP